MTTLLCPTRGRPQRFRAMAESALSTADGPIEIVAVLDHDDPTFAKYPEDLDVVQYVAVDGSHKMSDLWNVAYGYASESAAYMLCADDLVFVTRGWDAAVTSEILSIPDRLLFVWCNDGTEHAGLATHPFISREWVELAGRFTAPYFDVWYADAWLLDVALKVGRMKYLAEYKIEHQHQQYGSAPDDETYERRRGFRPFARAVWDAHEYERVQEAAKIWSAMDQNIICYEQQFEWLYEAMLYRLEQALWR